MNKTSLILLASLATSVTFADTEPNYYDASTNPSTFEVTNSSKDNPILVLNTETGGVIDVPSSYDGTTGAVITAAGSPGQWGSATVGEFSNDFTFNSGIAITNNGYGGNSFFFYLYNSSKITINSYMGYDNSGSKTTHYRFTNSDSGRGKVEINTNLTLADDWASQMWLEAVDTTYNGTDNSGKFGYTHFKFAPTLTITKNLYIKTLDLRGASNGSFGSITINNSALTLGTFKANSSDTNGTFSFIFANTNKAETVVIDGINDEINTKAIDVLFVDFGVGDSIYSQRDLTELNSVKINGTLLSELIAKDLIDIAYDKEYIPTGTEYAYVYTLVTVPEPAEWAVIFGAIALGFVAYRKRK